MTALEILELRCKVRRPDASYKSVKDDGGGAARATHDDSALARRLSGGEAGAFEELVCVYHARVHRLATRLLGWRATSDIDDAVQDIFLAALSHAKSVRAQRGLWPWLATITLNACRTQRRKTWTRLRFLRKAFASGASEEGADDSPEADELFERVREAVSILPARDREVIVLHYLEELSSADIATVLGVTVNAVDVRLHRARAKLKEHLKDEL
jgi:RNA polymerase sigma-70 factor (ECF subfamily)